MVLEFKDFNEAKEYFSRNAYELKYLNDVEESFTKMWAYLEKNHLLKELNPSTGHEAYCQLKNSYLLISSTVNLMVLAENFYNGLSEESSLSEEQIFLIVTTSYNVFIEKIAQLMILVCDVEKLCNLKKNQFCSASNIISALEKIVPESTIFKYANRPIRNSIAHYNFNVAENKFIYNHYSKEKGKIESVVLDKKLILNGTLSLNRLLIFIYTKIENFLEPFFDKDRLNRDTKSFNLESDKIISSQKNLDRL